VAVVGKRSVRIGSLTALSLGALVCLTAHGASAAGECPDHPDALGTSRTLVVDPREHPRVGAMQYSESLPLRDHEVVLTFDDGPVPRHSNQVLQILADQCVKATFFIIGHQAQANPEGVRKLVAAGHTVGTHSQNHPLTFNKMSVEQAKQEVDQGIASTLAALGDPTALAPFFRVPGLLRGEGVETYAASQGLQLWSADFLADDWRHIPSGKVYDLAIKRLEARGKGIFLLHDIQARTVAALPKILHELKARGYHIVNVVAATAERPATPTEPQDWQLHPILENVPTAHWPKVPDFDLAGAVTLPTATLEDVVVLDENLPHPAGPTGREQRSSHGVLLPSQAPWPRQIELSLSDTAPALPVPEASLFQSAEQAHAPTKPLALLAHHDAPADRLAKEPAPPPIRSARAKPSAAASRASHGRRGVHASRELTHVTFDMGSSLEEGSSGASDTSAIQVATKR
jgi:peptidoglycan-N-acetylglucosamine deacetylase